jgi:hypothetical protein
MLIDRHLDRFRNKGLSVGKRIRFPQLIYCFRPVLVGGGVESLVVDCPT